jgi:hypothetical protein
MIEINEYRRSPAAPSILVNKIGGIYRVNQSITKVTLALSTPTAAGTTDTVEAVNLLWENGDLHAAQEMFEWAFREIERGTFIASDGERRGRSQ